MSGESLNELKRLISCHRPLLIASSSSAKKNQGGNVDDDDEEKKRVMEDSVNECLTGIVHVLSTVSMTTMNESGNDNWKEDVEYTLRLIMSSSCHYHLVWEMLVSTISSMWEMLHGNVREWILDWLPIVVWTEKQLNDTLHVLQDIIFRNNDELLPRILGVLSQITIQQGNTNSTKAILDLCLTSLTILSPQDWPTLLQTISTCISNDDKDEEEEMEAFFYGSKQQQQQCMFKNDEEYHEMIVATVHSIRNEWNAIEKQQKATNQKKKDLHTRAMVAHIWLQIISRNSILAQVYMEEYHNQQKQKQKQEEPCWNLIDGVSIILLLFEQKEATLNSDHHQLSSLLQFILFTLVPNYLDTILYDQLISPLIHILLHQFVQSHLVISEDCTQQSSSTTTSTQTLILDTWFALYPKLKAPQRDQVITTFLTLTSWNVADIILSSSCQLDKYSSTHKTSYKSATITNSLKEILKGRNNKKGGDHKKHVSSKLLIHQMTEHGMKFLAKIAKDSPHDLSNYKHILIDRLWLEQDKVPDKMVHLTCAVLTEIHSNKLMLLQKLIFAGHIDQQKVGLIWAQHILKREPQHKDEITKWVVKCIFSSSNNSSKKLWHPSIGLAVLNFWKSIRTQSIFSHVKSMVARSGLIQLETNKQSKEDTNLLQFDELPPYIDKSNAKSKRMVFCISSFLQRSFFNSNVTDISTTMTFVYEVMDTYLEMGRRLMKRNKWSPDGWLLAKVEFPFPGKSFENKLQLLCAFNVYIALSTAILKHSYRHFLSRTHNSPEKLLLMLRYQISKIYTVSQEYASLSNEIISSFTPSNNNMKNHVDNKMNKVNCLDKENNHHQEKNSNDPVIALHSNTKTTILKDKLFRVDIHLFKFLCQERHIPSKMLWVFLFNKEDNDMIQSIQRDGVVTTHTCEHVFRDWDKLQDLLILRCAVVNHIKNLVEESIAKKDGENIQTEQQRLEIYNSICRETLDRKGLWMLFDQTKIFILFLIVMRKESSSPTISISTFKKNLGNCSKDYDDESSVQPMISQIINSILDIVKDLVVVSIGLLRITLLDSRTVSGTSCQMIQSKNKSTVHDKSYSSDGPKDGDKAISQEKSNLFEHWIFNMKNTRSKEEICKEILNLISSCEYIEIAWELLDLLFSIAFPPSLSTTLETFHSIQDAGWRLLLTIFVDDPLSKDESILFWHTLMHDRDNAMESLPKSFQFAIEYYIETNIVDEGVDTNFKAGPRDALSSLLKFSLKSTKAYKDSYVLSRNILASWSLIAVESILNPHHNVCCFHEFFVKLLESMKGTINDSLAETTIQNDNKNLNKEAVDGFTLRIPKLSGTSFSVCFELLMAILCASVSIFVPSLNKVTRDGLKKVASPYEDFRNLSIIFKTMLELFSTNLSLFPRRTFAAVLRACSLMIQVCEDRLLTCIEWRNSQPIVHSHDRDGDFASVQYLATLINDIAHNCSNSILIFCSYVKKQTQQSEAQMTNKKIAKYAYIHKGIIALVLRTEKFVDFLRTICTSHNLIFDLNHPPSSVYEDLLPKTLNDDRGYHQRSHKKSSNKSSSKPQINSTEYEAVTKLLFPTPKKRKRASLTTLPFDSQKDYKNKMFS